MVDVSVIVPIYNVEHFLPECIDSILGQSFREFELILVDDGSTDSSGALADAYQATDSRVRVIHQHNMGLSGARNSGIEAAAGEWLTIVDGDDWLEPDALEIMIASASKTDADIVIFSYFRESPKTSFAESFFNIPEFDATRSQVRTLQANCLVAVDIGNRRSTTNMGVTWARLYRRSFILENNLRFKVGLKRMQDAIFHLYALEHANKVAFRNKHIYHYRVWPGAASRKFTPDFRETASEILEEISTFMTAAQATDFEDIYFTKAGKLFLDTIKLQYVGNPMSLLEKRRQLGSMLRDDPYSKARKRACPRYMTRGQAAIWPLIRMGLPTAVYFLYALRARIRSRS